MITLSLYGVSVFELKRHRYVIIIRRHRVRNETSSLRYHYTASAWWNCNVKNSHDFSTGFSLPVTQPLVNLQIYWSDLGGTQIPTICPSQARLQLLNYYYYYCYFFKVTAPARNCFVYFSKIPKFLLYQKLFHIFFKYTKIFTRNCFVYFSNIPKFVTEIVSHIFQIYRSYFE